MKDARRRLILLLCVVQPGCSFFYYGAKNLVEAPLDARDEQLMRCRFNQMADDAWRQTVVDDPSLAEAYHYGAGFRRGFADYLEANGTGQPPGTPPWEYRSAAFETPRGQRDIEDWYAGFRSGAAAARAGGYRDAAVVLPLALPPAYGTPKPAPAPQPPATAPQAPAPELLPAPHKAPPAQGRPQAQSVGAATHERCDAHLSEPGRTKRGKNALAPRPSGGPALRRAVRLRGRHQSRRRRRAGVPSAARLLPPAAGGREADPADPSASEAARRLPPGRRRRAGRLHRRHPRRQDAAPAGAFLRIDQRRAGAGLSHPGPGRRRRAPAPGRLRLGRRA